ncbi:MAG: hypothetical protein CMD99_05345 [Gammaproteobacteria bacterium]|nr:hypothetical protein [Gammaproteobacteria bacterium]
MERSRFEPSARNLPVQKRAREKYELILRETCCLLEETGFVGLSTREIARRANCNIATIYRYFGGVNDIIMALGEPFFSGISALFDHMISQIAGGESLESAFEFFMETFTNELSQNQWALHAEAGILTDKNLIAWNSQFMAKIEGRLTGVLAIAGVNGSTAELEVISFRLIRHWKTYMRTLVEYDDIEDALWLQQDTVRTSLALVDAPLT